MYTYLNIIISLLQVVVNPKLATRESSANTVMLKANTFRNVFLTLTKNI